MNESQQLMIPIDELVSVQPRRFKAKCLARVKSLFKCTGSVAELIARGLIVLGFFVSATFLDQASKEFHPYNRGQGAVGVA